MISVRTCLCEKKKKKRIKNKEIANSAIIECVNSYSMRMRISVNEFRILFHELPETIITRTCAESSNAYTKTVTAIHRLLWKI